MQVRNLLTGFVMAASLLGAPACTVEGHARVVAPEPVAVVTVETPEPPARVEFEAETTQVRPGYVWASGHWVWNGREWVWGRGHWMVAQGNVVWAPGRWELRGRQRVWVEGGVRPAPVRTTVEVHGTVTAPPPPSVNVNVSGTVH